MELNDLRKEIDGIDEQLTELFIKRMAICAKIAKYKQASGVAVCDGSRERAVLDKVTAQCEKELVRHVTELYKTIFEISRTYQTENIQNISARSKENV